MAAAAEGLGRMDTEDAAESSQDVGEIRVQIEQTRAEMGETIDAIKEKLNPEHLTQQARERIQDATVGRAQAAASAIRDTMAAQAEEAAGRAQAAVDSAAQAAREAGSMLGQFLRANGLVAALAGAGVACLWIRAWLNSRASACGE